MKNKEPYKFEKILFDAKLKRSKQENIFPAALVNIVGEVAVKRHNLIFDFRFLILDCNSNLQIFNDKDRVNI